MSLFLTFHQVRSTAAAARRLLLCAIWLLLAFAARVVIYGVLAVGYYTGTNPQCPDSPTLNCDPCQSSFYVLTSTIELVPSM